MEIPNNLKLYLDHLMIYLGKLEGTVKFIFYSALIMLAFRFEYSMIIMVIMLALLIFFIEIHKTYKRAFFRRQLEEFKQKIQNESIQPYNYNEQFDTINVGSKIYNLSKTSEINSSNLE